MIFSETIDWVLNISPHTGQPKTSTLRPICTDQSFEYWGGGARYVSLSNELNLEMCEQRLNVKNVYSGNHSRTVYRVGATRAVQPGRGKPSRGTIEITGIKFASPASLTDLELHAEGFDTRERFEAVWERLHGKGKLGVACWLIEFRKV
jgi:hypothetical protein